MDSPKSKPPSTTIRSAPSDPSDRMAPCPWRNPGNWRAMQCNKLERLKDEDVSSMSSILAEVDYFTNLNIYTTAIHPNPWFLCGEAASSGKWERGRAADTGTRATELSEFQGISSQSDPSRPEAIYIICFRVTAWLDSFSSVRHMYSCLWKQQQKKKPLINRSTKMQCLNQRRLGVSRALQPPSDSSIFLRGTIMPQNSGNFYERSNQYWRPISWLQWR